MTIKGITQSFRRGLRPRKNDSGTDTQTAKREGSQKPASNGTNTTPSSSSSVVAADGNQDLMLNGIGPYKFVGPLGNGKFSRVMLAKHMETDKQVAVKIIDKQAHDYRVMSRLVREIYLMEMLDHENIVKIYETFETCDSLFLVMEYVPGMNLDEYLHQKGGTLSEDEARRIFRQLVSAVYFCHNRWVVHRDLKTPNILITPDGTVKLADFGLGNRFGLQRLKTICGSMLYYSPEIITGQKYFGPEVDCWCLGIALFRMTAGFEPFSHAHTVGELKKDVCSCNFPMPSNLSPELQATIYKCLQTDRRKRMTVRQALREDPWLTNFGQLPCPFANVPKTAYDEIVGDDDDVKEISSSERAERERRARRQFMKDMERDKNIASDVKRTIIYHPINPSTYYTTKTPSSATSNNNPAHQHHLFHHHYHHQHEKIEFLRSELLQSIRNRERRLGIRTADRWDTLSIRSPVQALALRLKSSNSTDTRKSSTSTPDDRKSSKFSEMMQRLTKDHQVYYFHTDRSNRRGSRPPSLSSSLSTSTSSLSSATAPISPQPHDEDTDNKTIRETMSLLRHTCQLMGITYMQETPSRLLCVLTLRDAPKKTAGPNKQPASSNNPPPPVRRRGSRTSSHSTATTTTTTDDMSAILSGVDSMHQGRLRRLSLPLLSHLTSSMTTSFFGRTKQRHSMDEQGSAQETTPNAAQTTATAEARNKKKDGVALFTIDVEVQKRTLQQNTTLIALRFSKQHGSNTVFKMAGGWVSGVMGLDGRQH